MANYLGIILLLFINANSILTHPPLQLSEPTHRLISEQPKPYQHSTSDAKNKLGDIWIPYHYNVKLTINLDNPLPGSTNFTAEGDVEIDFTVTQSTNTITLHAHPNFLSDMVFTLTNKNNSENIVLTTPTPGPGTHFLTMGFTDGTIELLPDFHYVLRAQSTARISLDSTNGLYRSNYTAADGSTRLIAATQMESWHLRQVFPCFDEPQLKAVFTVELTHEGKYKAIANGLGEDPEPVAPTGWVRTRFGSTVEMSSYLFAITIAEFDSEDGTGFSKPVKTWADPALIAKGGGKYTADLTARLLQFFDDYFETTYPMEKMDSAAITHKGGAMENWGLILYRTDLLIYLEGETLETSKNSIASVVSHEVAHQNFGNLVTCEWWSDIWLNEGFATYVSYLGIDAVAPEFRHAEWQINDAFQPALVYDAGPNTHPLRNAAESPEEIDTVFSSITYDKGASINRMIEGFLTLGTFHKGLNRYLEAKKFQGAKQDELFQKLQEVADEDSRVFPADVRTILNTWTIQSGHPLVRVSVRDESSVFISQERYAPTPAGEDPAKLWYVPITILSRNNNNLTDHQPQLWLTEDESIEIVEHPELDVSKWVMINADATGFYRVLYDSELTLLIRTQLMANPSEISPLSRSQLLDDYFNLAFRGYVNIETALELTTYLAKEDHFTVWEVVFNQLRNTYKFLEDPTSINIFQKYLLPKLTPHLVNIGIPHNSTHPLTGAQEILRMKLMDWACSMGSPECVMHAHELHAEWEEDTTVVPIHVDIQGPVFCVIAAGGKSGFDLVMQIYETTETDMALKMRLLNALACAEGDLLEGLLNSTLEASSIHPDHRVPLIQRIAMNTAGRELVIRFLSVNMESIIEVIGGGQVSVVTRILSGLSSQVSTQEGLDALLNFVSVNQGRLAEITPTLLGHINTIRANINWVNQWGRPIVEWMERNPHPPKEIENAGGRIGGGGGFIWVVALLVGGVFVKWV